MVHKAAVHANEYLQQTVSKQYSLQEVASA